MNDGLEEAVDRLPNYGFDRADLYGGSRHGLSNVKRKGEDERLALSLVIQCLDSDVPLEKLERAIAVVRGYVEAA